MLHIACPFCGPRDEIEFRYGGESHIERPSSDASDEVWGGYLFNHRNEKGVHLERWCHGAGCGQWFNLARSTVTHEILAVYKMGEKPPEGLE